MPNSVTKGRSRIAILAVVSVIASLFTLAALPASAATGDVEAAAEWSACVNAATEDAGFGDTTGHFADAWIDCIAHYGVTTGTTATTYSPGQAVTRAQMALFLIRAAGPAGISVPAATDQGFTDIAGLPQATQDAINQLAALDITKGTSATTYGPNDTVARYQMALFLNRFLGKAGVTVNGTSASGFTDTGSVSFEAYNAIEDVYDFGITTGTTATTYSPYAAVNRGQMAAFIGRMLGHTNARPAGVTIQAKPTSGLGTVDPVYQVSYRDASFQPAQNVLVDLFYATWNTGETAVNPVKADGTIDTSKTTALSGALEAQIDNGDRVTNAKGNIDLVAGTLTAAAGTTVQLWGWTGAVGSSLDVDTTTPGTVVIVSNGAAATHYSAKANTPANATTTGATNAGYTNVKFGTAITVALQATNGLNGTAVAQSGVEITVKETRTTSGGNVTITSTKVTTDASGAASYAVAAATDPTTTNANTDWVSVKLEYTDNAGLTDPGNTLLEFNDNAPVLDNVTLTSSHTYGMVSGAGTTVTVTATAYDQFGFGKADETVDFSLNGGAVNDRTTNSAGVAAYAFVGGTTNGSDEVAITLGGGDSVTVYWGSAPSTTALGVLAGGTANVVPTQAFAAAAADQFIAAQIVAVDTDNDKFVVQVNYDSDTTAVLSAATIFVVYTYDANDVFFDGGVAKTFAEWETALTGLTLPADMFDGTNNGKIAVAAGASEYRIP